MIYFLGVCVVIYFTIKFIAMLVASFFRCFIEAYGDKIVREHMEAQKKKAPPVTKRSL
jgi:hypothetical protein